MCEACNCQTTIDELEERIKTLEDELYKYENACTECNGAGVHYDPYAKCKLCNGTGIFDDSLPINQNYVV